jgi:sugar lactone lactonase YvrE
MRGEVKAERITDSVAYHGEGPVWSERWGGLRWVDMLAGDVLSLAEDGSIGRRHVGDVAAALRPRTRGGAVIGVERGFALEDADGGLETLDELWGGDAIRMNEGGCDPDGRFYCGTMAYDKTPGAASIYRLDPDGSTEVVLTGVTVSNGLEWSPDGALAYYNDTDSGEVSVFDYDREAGLTGRRTFAPIPDNGRPDGLTVDGEGNVWTALNGWGQVWSFGPGGEREAVVEVGARKVTACTFGGPGLDQLFITTSRENLAPDEEPPAGSLYSVSPGVSGRPVREFAG